MEYNHEDQPPIKKPRLGAPTSPAMSDNFSDPDDLYDTPVKAQESQRMENAQDRLAEHPSQAPGQPLSTGIPGLSFTTAPVQSNAQADTVPKISSPQPQSLAQDPQTQLEQPADVVNSISAETLANPPQAREHSAVQTDVVEGMQSQPELVASDEKNDEPVATYRPTSEIQDEIQHTDEVEYEPTPADFDSSADRGLTSAEIQMRMTGQPTLTDLQMQLYLLEQQHIRRLTLARQARQEREGGTAGITRQEVDSESGDESETDQVAPGAAETDPLHAEKLETSVKREISGVLESTAAEDNNAADDNVEFEYDSSPLDASDDSSSSSDDEGSEDDYELLDPAEMARILMREEGGDDDDRPKPNKNNKEQTRGKNETPVVKVEKPNVDVTPEMAIKELGHVENIVENYVLVKGTLSGEIQVLESGSVLCLENRKVIGAVDDLVGRVEEPRYSVAFTNGAEVAEYGITHGTKIFYVVDHSSYVFTQPLRNMKGYDTSNVNDEEAGVDEMEFSDDEAEAEYKRKLKQEKLARKGVVKQEPNTEMDQQAASGSADVALKYDDDDAEDLYKPLPRPVDYGSGTPSLEMRTPQVRGRGRGRGGRDRGGERGRGRGGRGGRGNDTRGRGGRGGFSQPDVLSTPEPPTQAGSHASSPAQYDRASSSRTENPRPLRPSPPKAQARSNTAAAPSTQGQQAPHPYNNANPSFNNFGSQGQPTAPYGNQYPPFPAAQEYQQAYQGYNQPQFPLPPPVPGQYPMMPYQHPQPGFPMPPPGSFVNPNFYQQFANQQQQYPTQPQQPYQGNPNQQQQGWPNYQQNYRQ